MPDNKNKCCKCKKRHTPPTGKKCKQFVDINEGSDGVDNSGQVVNMSGSKDSQNLQLQAVGPVQEQQQWRQQMQQKTQSRCRSSRSYRG